MKMIPKKEKRKITGAQKMNEIIYKIENKQIKKFSKKRV